VRMQYIVAGYTALYPKARALNQVITWLPNPVETTTEESARRVAAQMISEDGALGAFILNTSDTEGSLVIAVLRAYDPIGSDPEFDWPKVLCLATRELMREYMKLELVVSTTLED
jgi:hypothetical protein